ncbi:MAG: DNA mismatch repair endonuclease MutL [Lachnospiraceae bacterium]|nr:DNA mismatch repair endonuclease MutL [Lachnospiraceae bacterium]
MQKIHVLDAKTIDQIAAGEVIERPASVVKELLENAIDAGADHITVEIKNGGIDHIRVTDNGSGIDKEDIRTAFLSHATSKILSMDDLLKISSLGFRGEALSSIASVSKTEMLTKTSSAFCGTRYVIEGGREMILEDAGVPDGTTIIVRNLFYNVPARRKYLKTAMTEASHITDLMERMILSRPKIAFKYIVNNDVKMQSNGDGDLKNLVYMLYGKSVADSVLPIDHSSEKLSFYGLIGKPELARGNHNYEFYFVNQRSVQSTLLNKALDDAYDEYMMQHKFPYAILYFEIPGELLDVNVHPQKSEIRFLEAGEIYQQVQDAVKKRLHEHEMILDAGLEKEEKAQKPEVLPEPFETNRLRASASSVSLLSEAVRYMNAQAPESNDGFGAEITESPHQSTLEGTIQTSTQNLVSEEAAQQLTFLNEEARKSHRLIGQLFDTYWLVEYEDKLYLIDQHAAHEKIRYERLLKHFREQINDSQMLNPPLLLSLSIPEEETFLYYRDTFQKAGFEIEHFGGRDYAFHAVPTELYGMKETDYFKELLDSLKEDKTQADMETILARLATMSCKGAIKAGNRISFQEADALLNELLTLDNPYHCPHGRPVIISFSKTELEKKFKRILS